MTQTNEKFKLFEIVESLSYSMDLVSETLVGHHKRVAYISLQLGKSMGLSITDIRKLVIAALIHDLGVFYLNQHLSDLSFDSADNQHAEIGYRLLEEIFPLEDVATIIRYHHQNWNVSKGTNSHLMSHILHLADKIAVLIEGKPIILDYRQKIIATIRHYSGKYFHPGIVDHFLGISNKEYFWLDAVSNRIIEYNLSSFFVAHCGNNIGYEEVLNIGRIISHIIDFRSSFTATHSDGVAAIATHLCKYFNFNLN